MEAVALDTVRIHCGQYGAFMDSMVTLAENRNAGYVCFANAHMLTEAWRNQEFAYVLNKATLVCPDGQPVALLMRQLFRSFQDRVAGMDVLQDLLHQAHQKGWSVFFVGGTEAVRNQVLHKLESQLPGIRVVGYELPSVSDEVEVDPSLARKIIAENPHLVVVSLGCPKQERWMAAHAATVPALMLGVGGALEVFSGERRRAPLWLQKWSLEWLFRLAQDPARLWRRYLYTNTFFVFKSIRLLFRKI